MSLQSSIQKFAEAFLSSYDRLDVLIQNAAIFDISQKEPVITEEGIESVWATNHLGPVLLTDLLWLALKKSPRGRVITIASQGLVAKPFLQVDLEDPEFKSRRFSVEKAYYQSKLAQVMYTFWLADKGKDDGVTANCIRVTNVKLDVDKYPGLPEIMKRAYAIKSKFSISPEEMATTYTTLATLDKLKNVTGKYFDEKMRLVQPRKYARQPENIEAVMELTINYLKR
jgi:NAD(P)-dependent dehydrogenase (short-subunit alcohol dehydrogenase family)